MKHNINTAKQSISAPNSQSLASPGQSLRDIRLAKGICGDYVQRQLGLGDSIFQALEADDYRRLPAPVFVKGYLRRYAELMSVRPAPVLASYQRFLESQGLAPAPSVASAADRPLIAMAGSAIALLLATSLVFGAMLVDGEAGESAGGIAADQLVYSDGDELTGKSPEVTDSVTKAENTLDLSFTTDSWVEGVDSRDHILAVSLQRA